MNRSNYPLPLLRVLLIIFATGLQIWAEEWRPIYQQRITLLQFGTDTLWLGLTESLLGIISGFLIALALFPKLQDKMPTLVFIVALLLPAFGVALKLGYAVTIIRLPVSMGLQILISNWALSSVPSILLGMTSALFFKRAREAAL